MRTRSRNPFTTVTTAGLLLPVDLLTRVVEGDADLKGLTPKDYHLRSGERLNEAASRAWNECLAAWTSFRKKYAALPASDAGTSVTRDEWLLPLFQELGYGRLQAKKAIVIEGKEYPISHGWENHVPIHLLSARYPLDRRTPEVAGAATRAPYSLLQEQLNRSAQHRWGFVSNGLKLFLLRDNAALARAANVEFDLEAMMDGEVYSDFMLLFLLCHQSRVEILGSSDNDDETQRANPEDCWLEKWASQADQQGTRAREKLRDGVEAAIRSLGAGFLTTKGNNDLRERLRTGELSTQDYYRQLLRVVYRLLMLLVAEEKKTENGDNLLHPTDTPPEVRDRYARFYSVGRIRSLAYERRGTAHTDLYESLKVLFLKLREGYAPLGIPGMGSFLFSDDSTPDLDDALLANQDLLDAFRNLCYTEDTSGRGGSYRRPVDFGNLGSEELGSVYESLLELHPQIDTDEGPFTLGTAAGHERKTTGSYYTPRSLINCLLDSALDPVVNEAIDVPDAAEAERKLLDLKVCDPACGSGHFLIAAAERMATHLARLRTGDDQPNTLDVQHAKRDIIGRCIYGVDVNPMAVELCKVSLWMEALEPGKPLSFLDHHIQCGNSLLGATPRLLSEGIPDDAFKPIEGDDKKVCSQLKKDNKKQRKDYEAGYRDLHPLINLGDLPQHFAKLTQHISDTVEDTTAKANRYVELVTHASYETARLLADYWCAAFVWKKDESSIGKLCPTERDYRRLQAAPSSILPHVKSEVRRLADRYQFFHWHLAFPNVFVLPEEAVKAENEQTGWSRGFDVVLGNPPWERIKFQEAEWLKGRIGELDVPSKAAARRRFVDELAGSQPQLYEAFLAAKRQSDGYDNLLRLSGTYPLCGVGRDINSGAVFSERTLSIVSSEGRSGTVVPSSLATESTTKLFIQHVMRDKHLVSFFDFENRKKIFPAVDSRYRFALMTLVGGRSVADRARFTFYAHEPADLRVQTRVFGLSFSDVQFVNPNTMTVPVFFGRGDALIATSVYSQHKVLLQEATESGSCNLWRFRTRPGLFHMGNDSELFADPQEECDGRVALYEAKMLHQFDHRWATFESGSARDMTDAEHQSPFNSSCPRYTVPQAEVHRKLTQGVRWLVGIRDVTNATNERTVICSAFPPDGAGDTIMLADPLPPNTHISPSFIGVCNSFVFDYFARQKVPGVHLKPNVFKQLPAPSPESLDVQALWQTSTTVDSWLIPSLLELTYTAWDLEAFASDCGYDGPPFRWDDERRFQIRCELDAAYFHLYLGSEEEWGVDNPQLREMFPTPRDAVDYIMDTFPIVRRKDEAKYDGDYRTKTTILQLYDAMAEAIRTGQPYQTRLNPPPGPPTDSEGNFIPFDQWTADLNTSHIHPPRVDRQRVEQGRLVLDLLLLLEAWKQPVSITALEPALLLMRNDAARKALQERELTAADQAELQSPPQFIIGIDRLYAAVEANGAIRKVGEHGYELAKPELLNEASQSDRDRANEIIQAVADLNDLRSLSEIVAELTDERYEVTV